MVDRENQPHKIIHWQLHRHHVMYVPSTSIINAHNNFTLKTTSERKLWEMTFRVKINFFFKLLCIPLISKSGSTFAPLSFFQAILTVLVFLGPYYLSYKTLWAMRKQVSSGLQLGTCHCATGVIWGYFLRLFPGFEPTMFLSCHDCWVCSSHNDAGWELLAHWMLMNN